MAKIRITPCSITTSTYSRRAYSKPSNTITGSLGTPSSKMTEILPVKKRKKSFTVLLPEDWTLPLYTSSIPLLPAKVQDLKKLATEHLPEPQKHFYMNLKEAKKKEAKKAKKKKDSKKQNSTKKSLRSKKSTLNREETPTWKGWECSSFCLGVLISEFDPTLDVF